MLTPEGTNSVVEMVLPAMPHLLRPSFPQFIAGSGSLNRAGSCVGSDMGSDHRCLGPAEDSRPGVGMGSSLVRKQTNQDDFLGGDAERALGWLPDRFFVLVSCPSCLLAALPLSFAVDLDFAQSAADLSKGGRLGTTVIGA